MSFQTNRNSMETSEVSKFYQGKSLFITGAAGFLGVVLLETLLRCCQDIQKIYILLRSKKGVQPDDRKAQIFKKEIFYKLKETNPKAFEKVIVINGDISKENLGMCEDDLMKIINEVSIVFHCAATISFLKPISFIVEQNVMGTCNIIELCRKLKNLEVVVFTSTAYSNCNRKCIEEKVYKLPFAAEEVVKKSGSEEELTALFNQCEPRFPNFYTFSKCVVENLILEKASDLPISIVRPSIIFCSMKGVLPGFIEFGSGLVSLMMGVGQGFLRVLKFDEAKICDQIPVDVVANTHILAAYHQVRDSLPSAFVYNCTSGELAPLTWGDFVYSSYELALKNPLPTSYQRPGFIVCKNSISYWFHSVLNHYIQAIIIDCLFWITGFKLRLLKLYRILDDTMQSVEYFTFNEWKFRCENFKSLSHKFNAVDTEMFPVDLKDFNIQAILEYIPINSPLYRRGLQKPYDKSFKKPFLYYINFASVIKWVFLIGIASAVYKVIF